MTKPPCKDKYTGADCPKRKVGCKADCTDWSDWQVIHAREYEEERRKRTYDHNADGFLVEQKKRHRKARNGG